MSGEKVVESEAQTTQSSFSSLMNVCGSCKENLSGKDPMLMPCLHTFCRSCVLSSADANNEVQCPTCHYKHKMGEVISNPFVYSLASPGGDGSSNQQEEQRPSCTACEENTQASSYCIDCTEWLCDQCVQAHRRVRMTKDHTIEAKENVIRGSSVSMSNHKAMHCPVHKQESLKLYCETCDKLTCRDCQLLEHKEHKYLFVHEASTQYKLFLQTLLDKIREKRNYIENAKSLISRRNQEIVHREEKVTQEIKGYTLSLIDELKKRAQRLIHDLVSICGAKKTQLGQKQSEILTLSQKLDHCMKFTQFIVDNGDNTALLHSKRLLVNNLRNTLRTRCEVPNPNHVVDIRFVQDPNFATQIQKIGTLVVDTVPFRGSPGNTGGQSHHPPPPRLHPGLKLPPDFDKLSVVQKQTLLEGIHRLANNRAAEKSPGRSQATLPYPSQGNNHEMQASSSTGGSLVRTRGVFYPQSGLSNGRPEMNRGMHGAAHMINLAQLQNRIINRQKSQPEQQPTSTNQSQYQPTPQPIIIQPEVTRQGLVTPPLSAQQRSPASSDTATGTGNVLGNQTPVEQMSSGSRPSSSDSNKPSTTHPGVVTIKPEQPDGGFGRTSCSYAGGTTSKASSSDDASKKQPVIQSSMAVLNVSPDTAAYFPDIKGENDPAAVTSNMLDRYRRQSEGSITPPMSEESQSFEMNYNVDEPITDQAMNKPGTSGQLRLGARAAYMKAPQNESDPSEDYCAVCHNGGDLLCCENCPKVYHLQCHVPALSAPPTGDWQCRLCQPDEAVRMEAPEKLVDTLPTPGASKRKQPTGLTDSELQVCERILLELFCHDSSVPFHEPVPKSIPNYYKIISNPMDFGSIRRKLNRQHFNHYATIDEFTADVQLVFTNCATYNSPMSEVGQAGVTMTRFFEGLLARFVPFIETRPVTPASDQSDAPRHKRKKRPEEIRRIPDPVHYT